MKIFRFRILDSIEALIIDDHTHAYHSAFCHQSVCARCFTELKSITQNLITSDI